MINLPSEKRIFAENIIKKLIDKPLELLFFTPTKKGIKLENKIPYKSGFYLLSEKDLFGISYIYCGSAGLNGRKKNNIHNRIYRFGKTLLAKNRTDEDHPAAEKYRNEGNYYKLYFQYLLIEEIDFYIPVNINISSFDEILSSLLKVKYNIKGIKK